MSRTDITIIKFVSLDNLFILDLFKMEQTEEPINQHKGWVIGILIGILVVCAAYGVLMYEMYKKKKFIFKVYEPHPPGDQSFFYPLGGTTPMTADEIARRNEFLKNNSTPTS